MTAKVCVYTIVLIPPDHGYRNNCLYLPFLVKISTLTISTKTYLDFFPDSFKRITFGSLAAGDFKHMH